MNSEKSLLYELLGFIFIGLALITVIVGLFNLFSINVKVPSLPNF